MRKLKGFTITEIIIVVFFIVLFSTITILSYSGDKETFNLYFSARIFSQNLRNVQNMTYEQEESCKVGDDFPENYSNGYGVYIASTSENSYIIFADCNGDNLYNQSDDVIIRESYFEESIIIREFTPTLSGNIHINFVPPVPKIFVNGQRQEAEITIQIENNALENRTIKINEIGKIEFD